MKEKDKNVCLCKKEFDTQKGLSGHRAKCAVFQNWKGAILNEAFLRTSIESGKTINSIASELNKKTKNKYVFCAGVIIRECKKHDIKTPSIKESCSNKKTRDKYKRTCFERYGAENALSKNTDIYKKRNKAVIDKYGVKNVFQLESVKNKSKKTMMEKYGVDNSAAIPNRRNNIGERSGIHRTVEKILDNIGIFYESEKRGDLFKKKNAFLNRIYSPRPDIIIESKKIVIEINGDYWHGNPQKYKSSDVVSKWTGKELVEDIWAFDENRKKQIESFGYRVITIWENSILNHVDDVKEMLWKELK